MPISKQKLGFSSELSCNTANELYAISKDMT